MRPPLSSNPHNPSNGIQINGTHFPSPHPQQIRPQFQVGTPNGHQLAVAPFANPSTPFSPMPFFPVAPMGFQNMNANYMPMLHAQNAANMPQFLPNGQLNAQNVLQSVNQILQMQMANLSTQNLGLLLNTQMGMINGAGVLQQAGRGNAPMQRIPTNFVTNDLSSAQLLQNQNILSTSSAQPQDIVVSKDMNTRSSNEIKSHNNFTGNYRHNDSKKGYGTKQFHDRPFVKSCKYNNGNREKGKRNIEMKNFNSSFDQSHEGKKRPLLVNYTDKEIQQWREERKKNYPSKANLEKKLNEIQKQQETKDAAAELRRQQLKEILSKQAELGCEVADIPSHYLSGSSEIPRNSSKQNNSKYGKRERFGNKFDKRGKFHQNGSRFHKRQRFDTANSANTQNENDAPSAPQRVSQLQSIAKRTDIKREPSLLRKLLSSDIKRDNKRLLQALRFMVMNSFFDNLSEEPLKFPAVIVKDSNEKSAAVDDKQRLPSALAPGVIPRIPEEESSH